MRALAVLALTLVVVGCGRGREEAAEGAAPRPLPPAAYGRADAEPGRALLGFVRAARAGQADAVAPLLSRETRASVAPTPAALRAAVADFADRFEPVRGERVVLSRRLGASSAVAALAAIAVEEDAEPEPYAYAAALVRQGGQWRVELGGVVIGQVEPDPLAETDALPELEARAEAAAEIERLLLWLDGRPLAAARERELPFTATLRTRPPRPLAPGVHVAVVFADTDGAAGAVAWPFEVEE